MAEIVRRRSWGGVLPLGRHVSISGSRSIHAPSVSIAPSSFQEEQNARHHKQFKLEQSLGRTLHGGGGGELDFNGQRRHPVAMIQFDLHLVTLSGNVLSDHS